MRAPTITDRMQSWVTRLTSQDRFERIANLTLLVFLFSPGDQWYERITTFGLAATAFLYPPWKRSSVYWIVWFIFTMVVRNYINWPSSDNHIFLLSCWCLTLGCALLATDEQHVVKLNAQWYIGLVFGFATLWKAISAEYLNGSVFQYLLTTDIRFFEIAYFFGDYSSQMLIHNREALDQMWTSADVIQFRSAPQILVAQCMTWWTLLMEAAIAILFLVPNRYGWEKWRHLSLQLFIILTYPPTNIVGFAWILIILALAQCDERFRKIQLGYIVLFVLIALSSRCLRAVI